MGPPAWMETLQEGAGLSPGAVVDSGPVAAVPPRGHGPTREGGRGVLGAGSLRGGGAYARSFPRLQTTPSSHWPNRVHRRREANQEEAPAPGRHSRSPHWRSEGKLRQRGCSCPPRAPGAARRLQRPHRCRGRVLPQPGPGLNPALAVSPFRRAGAPSPQWGARRAGAPHWGRGPFPRLLLPALAASQARETSSGSRQTPLAGWRRRGERNAGTQQAPGALPASVSPPALRAPLAGSGGSSADNPSNTPSLPGPRRARRRPKHGPPRPGGRTQPRSLRAAAPAHLAALGGGMQGGGLRRRAAHHSLREQPPRAPSPPGTSPCAAQEGGAGERSPPRRYLSPEAGRSPPPC